MRILQRSLQQKYQLQNLVKIIKFADNIYLFKNSFKIMSNKKPFQLPFSTFSKKFSQDSKNQQSAIIVLSDSSEVALNEDIKISQEEQKPVKDVQNSSQENQNSSRNAQEKAIRLRTYEERLNLTSIQNKPSKKIKLNEQSEESGLIIRFNSTKNQVQYEMTQQDEQKVQRAKYKKAVPWIKKQTREIEDICLRLHNQAVEFFEYIKPTKKEHETRMKIFNMVKSLINEKYPQAKVEYFGSFATKLYLPDGDIDVTVLIDDIEEYEERKVYDTIHKAVRKNQGSIFCDIQYIRNSKVPLIKFVHIDTQLPFDISINKKDGIKQIEHVQRMKRLYPEFEPLVFVFKTMLKIRNMSETYTGGVGSFLLFCMILHFLRYVHQKQFYYTLGEYIMKFMEFYSLSGDWQRKSIYVADGSEVSRAREPGTLSFLSPQDDSHDIGKSAFKIRDVFNVFKNRFRVISGKNFKEGESILKELINPSLEEFRYYKYEKLMNKKVQ